MKFPILTSSLMLSWSFPRAFYAGGFPSLPSSIPPRRLVDLHGGGGSRIRGRQGKIILDGRCHRWYLRRSDLLELVGFLSLISPFYGFNRWEFYRVSTKVVDLSSLVFTVSQQKRGTIGSVWLRNLDTDDRESYAGVSKIALLMLEPRSTHQPTIIYRPILPSDLEALEQIHVSLFPIRYEREFFLNVVDGNGIVSWAAVDVSQSGSHGELIGFVTTRLILAKESELADLIQCNVSRKETTLVYILTLGVVEHYRNHGIATTLVREVIKYASSIRSCRAIYLHVISYNLPAISFYEKMSFKLMRRLEKFYYINGQHYDSYLFVYYVNGSRSPYTPLNIVAAVAAYFRGLMRMLASKLWRNEERHIPSLTKCKETNTLFVIQNKRILGTENSA